MDNLPKRKPTRLKEYDYNSEGAYFITICTHNHKNILCDIVGGGAFDAPKIVLSEIGKIVDKYILSTNSIPNLFVDKYVIMPNHIHLIIFLHGTMMASSPTKNIENIIRSFKILVTKEIGNSIWQRSYHDHIIRGEKDYQKIWEYIDTNPLRWEKDCFYNIKTEQ